MFRRWTARRAGDRARTRNAILLLGWCFLVDREAALRQSDFGGFLLARAAAAALVLALLFAIIVRAAAERAAGATSLAFYVLAAAASVVVGLALTAILFDAAR